MCLFVRACVCACVRVRAVCVLCGAVRFLNDDDGVLICFVDGDG